MENNIRKVSELSSEKKKLEVVVDERYRQMKNSFHSVKKEGKSVMVNKILIPVGIAVVAGYGLKKLIDFMHSEDIPDHRNHTSHQVEAASPQSSGEGSSASRKGILSGVNWSSLAVQLVPFIVRVGKEMYEDGNLPYFSPPEKVEEED